jgi:drug/metabolite transporter (DMT)-like permease
MRTSTLFLTMLTMVAFAANSILCRTALGQHLIDAASFAGLRLTSGAVMLWLIVRLRPASGRPAKRDFLAAGMLFLYAAAFSFAYLSLTAGTGALILFAAVQVTMVFAGWKAGEHFSAGTSAGLILSVAGLVYLVFPGLTSPPLFAAALMALAGFGWGIYSLRSRRIADPLRATATNFLGTVPLALALVLVFSEGWHATTNGVMLAIVSGAFTSGLGYVMWYRALRGLTSTAAASVQLSVPVIAAFGGIVLLNETLTIRLLVASVVILGGIALVLRARLVRSI